MRRTQIYLDDEQMTRLDERAAVDRVTRSAAIRAAVDAYTITEDDQDARLARFRAAVDEVFGIAPYLPPGDEYVEEMRGAGARKLTELERRWRD